MSLASPQRRGLYHRLHTECGRLWPADPSPAGLRGQSGTGWRNCQGHYPDATAGGPSNWQCTIAVGPGKRRIHS